MSDRQLTQLEEYNERALDIHKSQESPEDKATKLWALAMKLGKINNLHPEKPKLMEHISDLGLKSWTEYLRQVHIADLKKRQGQEAQGWQVVQRQTAGARKRTSKPERKTTVARK